MWVIAVDVVVVILGLGLLGLLAWRLVVRPGLALGRAVTAVAAQAGEALELLSPGQNFPPGDTRETSDRRVAYEGIDVP